MTSRLLVKGKAWISFFVIKWCLQLTSPIGVGFYQEMFVSRNLHIRFGVRPKNEDKHQLRQQKSKSIFWRTNHSSSMCYTEYVRLFSA